MSYKTILVHVDSSEHAAQRIALAAELARAHEAHLVGAAMSGFNLEFYRNSTMMLASPLPGLDELRQTAQQSLERFDNQARAIGVDSFEQRISDDDAETGLLLQAPYADLLVVGQTAPEDGVLPLARTVPESVALFSGRPVLVVPHAGRFADIGRRALVAWDGSRAAARAVVDALPLLRRSGAVTVAVFNPGSGGHGELPGADIATFLARHGVTVEVVSQQLPGGLDVGNALLSLAADLGTDLIVMGAYGHVRWREMLLGGVTRTILQTMTVPVLMSH